MIIGLVGKLQSGKTTVANILKEFYPSSIKIAFGDAVKEMILKAGLCTREELWGVKTDFSRLMMQKIGTDIIRKQVSNNFWIDKMREKINHILESKSDSVIIIDDVRFINEAELVRNLNGKLIRIVRPSLQQNKKENLHLSETEQDLINVNFEIINDSSLEDLKTKVFSKF